MGIHVYTMRKKHVVIDMFGRKTEVGMLRFAFKPEYDVDANELIPEQMKKVEQVKAMWKKTAPYRFVSISDKLGNFRDGARIFKLPKDHYYWFDDRPLVHVGYMRLVSKKWFFLPAQQYIIINKTDELE